MIAPIVLPLTLISGIYGMNFDIMPELRSPYGYYFALGLMAAVGGGMIGYFKKEKLDMSYLYFDPMSRSTELIRQKVA